MWTRSVLKEKARAAFARSRWGLILCGLILMVISGGFSGGGANTQQLNNLKDGNASGSASDYANMFSGLQSGDFDTTALTVFFAALLGIMAAALLVGIILSIFVCNPLTVGCYRYFLEASFEERKAGQLGIVGHAFKKGRYGNVIKTMFLMGLYEFFWSLLFIIPGIIKSYEYRMIPYILADDPTISTEEAFAKSREMMTGQKWKAFVLDLSFIGWNILSILTCGILAVFYVAPYQNATNAALYEALNGKDEQIEVIEPEAV